MAGSDGREDSPLIAKLRRQPRAFDVFQAVVALERAAAERQGGAAAREEINVGEAADPRTEAVRFGVAASLSFPTAEVEALRTPPPAADGEPGPPGADRPLLGVSMMGVHGFAGVLPQHYTELLWRRVRANDFGLLSFLDLFNHRAVSLFVRAWKKHRLHAQAWSGKGWEGEPGTPAAGIAGFVDAMFGFGTGGLRGRLAPPHQALRFYAGFLAGYPRSPVALEALLSDYFDEPITVETLIGRWEALDPSAQTRLSPGGFCRLGNEAVIGARVLHPEGAFRIRLGPLTYHRFRQFLPDREMLRHLVHLARLFVGVTLWFDVRPTLKREEVPQLRLGLRPDGDGACLGWNTWVLSRPAAADRDDAVLGCHTIA
jgi:type VI secretion system protein ImpH